MRHLGWSMPTESQSAENLLRSSAVSIILGEVPATLMSLSSIERARVFGIWPPTETIACVQLSAS